jgi:hypothetical protein
MNGETMSLMRSLNKVLVLAVLLWGCIAQADDIHIAANRGDMETIKGLLASNPKLVNEQDKNGFWGDTPLQEAAKMGRQAVVEYLLSKGADVNGKNARGETPLFSAVSGGKAIVELLLKHGADAKTKSDLGDTPLDRALANGKTEVAEVLRKAGSERYVEPKRSTRTVEADGASQQSLTPQPFGFRPGSSRSEVITLLGASNVEVRDTGWCLTKKAPKPHPLFENYRLLFSPKRGLVKMFAMSQNIPTSPYGAELTEMFTKVRDQLKPAYGKYESFDFLRPGSIWNEKRDWMMGLVKKERTLACFWRRETGASLDDSTVEVRLEAHGLETDMGMLTVQYEFAGFKEVEAEQGDAFR